MQTHHEGLHPVGGLVVAGIAVDGDEEVGMFVVGDFGAVVQGDEDIGFAGIDNLYVGAVFRNEFSDLQCDGQRDILFFALAPDGTGVFAAVSGIDHNLADAVLHLRERLRVKKCKYRK